MDVFLMEEEGEEEEGEEEEERRRRRGFIGALDLVLMERWIY